MKIILFILIPVLMFAQSDWSDVTVNYPDSLDDSTSIFKAVPGEAMRSANFNKLLRLLRIMQEKMGVLGSDSLLSSGEISDTSDAVKSQLRSDISDSIATVQGTTDADSIRNISVDTSGISNNSILKYNSSSGNWEIGSDNNSVGTGADFIDHVTVSRDSGDYLTIQSAINSLTDVDQDSQGTVVIYPGLYNEQVTTENRVNLYFMPGALLRYETATTGASLIVGTNDTVIISGGEFRCTSAGASKRIIKVNDGAKAIFNYSKFHSEDATISYYIENDGGYVECYASDFSHNYWGGLVRSSGNSTTILNGNTYDGYFYGEDTSNVIVNFKKWYNSKSGDLSTQTEVHNNSKMTITITDELGCWEDEDSYLDSLGLGRYIIIKEQAEINLINSVWNFVINCEDTVTAMAVNCWSTFGRPNISGDHGTGEQALFNWTVTNCDLVYAYEDWRTGNQINGWHIFEANDVTNIEAHLDVRNSTLQFGKSSSDLFYGNMYQTGWNGTMDLVNNIFIDYSSQDDGGVASYVHQGYIRPQIECKILGNTTISDGDDHDGWYVAFPAGVFYEDGNYIIAGNTYISTNRNISNKAFLTLVTDTRAPTTQDTINFIPNEIIQIGSGLSLFRSTAAYTDQQIIDSLKLDDTDYNVMSFQDIVTYDQFRGRGYANASQDQYQTIFSDGYVYSDTVAATGKDGDSLKIRFYPNQPLRDSGNNVKMFNDMILTFYLTAQDWQETSYTGDMVRFKCDFEWFRPYTSNHYTLTVDTTHSINVTGKIIYYAVDSGGTPSYQWIDLVFINTDSKAVDVRIWITTALNHGYLEFTRF